MLLQKDGLVSINAVAHEGKVVVIATDKNGGLWYTVKQDGFEESYLGSDPAKRTGWENWAPVDLPDEADDASVVAFETARLTRKVKPLTQLMRSVYKSRDLGAAFPVQLVSAQGHLYIFRQSKGKEATLLCDRFVLDGMTNKLGRKIEVRFKRSRQRLAPYEAGPKNAMAADSLDFRDTSGNFFYEPTTELLFTKGVKNGWFTVVRAATGEHEKFRWHIVYCNSKWAEMVSIRASEDGLFDLRDETTFDPAPGDGDPPIPRSIPGILWRTLKVPGAMITGGPAATLYDLQQEREVGNGGAMQLLRTETRLMLVLPTSQGTAAYSFALAKDGSLSELGSNGTPEVLRSDQREILLPLNTLDELKLIGDTTPPPQGTIRSMRLGSGDDNADGKVVVASAEAALLSSGDTIEIQKTSNYDGLYTVSVIDDQSFVIDVDFVDNQLGVWEKVETEPEGLVFDGMVTSYEKIADGKLKVTARNHGLSNGDGVQLVGTVDCDGTFPVTRLDNSTFVIDGKWATSEAKNLRLESLKRRGLVLDGDDDHIDLPMDAFPGGKEVTICLWARGIRTADVTLLEATDKDGKRVALISFPTAAGQISFECGNGADGCDRAQKAAQPAEYTDGWAHWAFTKNAVSGELAIYRNGVLWTSSTGKFPIGAAKQLRLGASIAGTIGKNRFEGTLAELTIYGRALRAEEIRDTMFLALSGQEPGLLGYWRLGGVVEGEIRKVIDLSPNGWDGTVVGGAWAGAVTYERKLRDGKTLAVRYTNSELIAVSQRATYVEEFEFRITAAGKPLTKAALQNMERSGKPVFVMRYWGKRSRSAEETIVFNPQPKTDLFADVGDGWLRASCRLTIPDGVALLRSFEIAEVRGTWDRIEIRKHGMRLISDAITELYNDDAPLLQPLAAAGKDLETQLSVIRADEQTEAGLYADKLATEEKIALLADAEYLKIEYDALVKDVAALTTELQELESQYVAMKDNPYNYFCRLLLSGTTKRFLHCEATGDMVTWDVGNLFEFIPYLGGYCIKPIGENRYILPGSNGRVVLSPNDFKWPWQVVRSGNSCTIKHPIYGFFHNQGGTNKIVMYKDAHNWELQPVDEVGGKVTAAKNARDAKKTELTAAEKRLAALKKLLDPTAPKRADLEKEIQDIVAKLVVVQTRLTAANAKYLDGVKGLSLGALAMPQIAKDQRGLLTRGAMLDFVRPMSRVSLLETCEGNVQLSYLDADGRMRLTHYDATSDSRNPQVEEWLTDAGRACLRQSKLGSAASIASAVKVEDTWSVEAWVATPLPTWEWTLLASATDQKNAALVVRHGVDLGLRCEGRFFSSGFRMDTLPVGWHHITAVRKGSGKSLAVGFYVDGEKVGSSASPRFTALSLDGNDDSVTLQPATIPQGSELTVSFWARVKDPGRQPAIVFEALDAQNRCALRISLPDANGAISFACGEDASGLDQVVWTAPPAGSASVWTHWAFTKNANTGLMRIYRNGRPWVRETGKKKSITPTTTVSLGKSAGQSAGFFCGDLSDLCVWNKELPATDIQSAMGCPVATDDAALLGCFRFEGGEQPRAKDFSKQAKHGTLEGSPTILEIGPPAQVDITKVTDTVNLEPPLPAVPPPPPLPPPPVRGPLQALVLDGIDDRVELPVAAIPPGNAITVCFWTKGGSALPRCNALIEAVDASRKRVLGIHMAWVDECVYWDCGGEGGVYDRIQKKAQPAEYKGAWVHWAFTKNATTGTMTVYRDGVLWHSGTGATRAITAPSAIVVGRLVDDTHYYVGELAEFSIWNKALSQQEVKDIKDRLLVGDEAGLVGYWSFTATGAIDLSANKRNGTYIGSPTVTTTSLPVLQPTTRGPLQALVLDGVDDHVKIPEMTVDFSQGLTIEAWVYYDKFQSYGRIFDFGNGVGNDNIVLYNNVTNPSLTLGIFRGTGDTGAFTGKPDSLVKDRWIHVAATVDAQGNATLYCDGASLVTTPSPLPNSVKRTLNLLGKTNWSDGTTFCGKLAEIKLWNRARTANEILQTMNQQLAGTEPGLVGYWAFAANGAIDLTPNRRHGTYVGNPTVNATNVPALQPPPSLATAPPAPTPPPAPTALPPPSLPPLKVFELRVWGTALSEEEVAVNSKTLLSGNEPGLLAYLPMSEPTGLEVRDQTGRGQNGTLEVAARWACSAQIGLLGKDRDSLVCAEYGSVALDPATQRKTSIMRRFFASATKGAVLVLPDKRVEELDLFWIGNAQFAPTLLGYIEGAPPIPSENLTENPSYNGATSVELVTSEDLEFRWNRSQELGAGLSLDGFLGYEDQLLNTMSGNQKMLDVRSGLKLNFNLNKTWQSETNITTRSSNRLTDRLELRGTPEQTPKFPDIGLRYIPKNVGYALVISGTADVFIMRLMRSGKMIGYQASPIEGIPPDVNTITFLMNPAYVMQGSLDGLTGSKPTSDRFHRHVPAMRAQYGGLYPASYYRLKEAYALKQQIENDDKRRESFFAQFSTSGMAASMESQIDEAKDPEAIGVSPGGGAGADQEQQKKESEEAAGAQSDAVKKKQAEIDRMIADPGQRAQAEAGFASWQKKMERLQVLAGKRNIVNTYVWDADGGLRTEQQSFASTAEHMIGGSFSVDGALGYEGQFNVMGVKAELTAMANMSFTQTMNKTRSTSKGIELNVDLSGVESIGITNHDDEPILPGEKVDRYRFMTFYLEGSTQNFHDFWSYVVDPEWLRSNGEEARALRQAMGKANKAWRVLHRVTYVERPALRGVGRDVRQAMDLAPDTAFDVVTKYLQSLTKNQLSIQAQLNDAVKILQGLRLKMGS